MTRKWITIMLLALAVIPAIAAPRTPADEPLLDWSAWQKYRLGVTHPAGVIKQANVERARENIQRYGWAQSYLKGVQTSADNWLKTVTPEWLAQFIPVETPGDTLFTPCPACRDQKKPAHPHGQYKWSASDPGHMICTICNTVYPSEQYPEDLVFTTKSGQKLSFYGGEAFNIFGFTARPSFTANIRARKVAYASSACRTLAEAYSLTGKPEYAQAARQVLLRFAQVYPNWLVHVGYGEYADIDPHIAALNINELPEDEITPTPKGPDRKLHSGYWQGGRATGTGMEAGFVRTMLEAYSFVCTAQADGKPVFPDEDRVRIEKDLLLESTVLLVSDKAVNNKSVGNATAVALAGMVLGHPEMVRFGLDVFLKTVDGWFLPDGGTSESYSYATMTLSGIEALGQAFAGYSDSPGYLDAQGKRIDKLDLYHDTAYNRVWDAMFKGLQGDLNYPPLADGHRTSGIGAHFAELMADNYPENEQYLALLKEFAGPKLTGGDIHTAIYYRPPGLEEKETPPLTLPDVAFPALKFGYLRSGEAGRDSALVLSASDWGGHHHDDSLNLYYWQQGKELLSDLGYLWDHPMSSMTRRTFAHNTVMLDSKEQATTGRGGEFMLFAPNGQIKVMEAESKAYPEASLYRRTVVQVEHEPGRQYVLDLFRVQGGLKHQYVFHGPCNTYEVAGPELVSASDETARIRFSVRLGLTEPGTEIQVDDVSITGPDGKEMAQNPSVADLDDKGKPAGFGLYHGDGTEEYAQAAEGRTDKAAVSLKAIQPGKEQMNVALMLGASDGYTGPNSYEAARGTTYKVSFWLRGNAKAVGTSVLYWPTDPANPADRRYLPLTGLATIAAKPQWTQYGGQFTIPADLDLTNLKASDAAAPWNVTWDLDGRKFSALWNNESGERSLLGDGWGQRDYRNSDVGAILPYLVRERGNGPAPSAYATVFEGYREGEQLVKSLRRLPVPEAEQANAVAVAVETANGTDYLVSCLKAVPLTFETPLGPLQVNGRFAAVSIRGGKVAAASLAEGTLLQLGDQRLTGN